MYYFVIINHARERATCLKRRKRFQNNRNLLIILQYAKRHPSTGGGRMLTISSKKALSFDRRWKDKASGALEGEGEAAEDGETGVGVAEHGLISPVQEVHAADEDLEPVGETVAEAGLEVDVAAGYCALAGG